MRQAILGNSFSEMYGKEADKIAAMDLEFPTVTE
jgi:hypothetical protein